YQSFSNTIIDEYIFSGQMSERLELNSSMEFNQYQGEYLESAPLMASYYQFNQYQTFPNARSDEDYVADSIPLIADMGTIYNYHSEDFEDGDFMNYDY
ncbi:16717_t:CDS:1, partial [Funneliformis geosporum]